MLVRDLKNNQDCADTHRAVISGGMSTIETAFPIALSPAAFTLLTRLAEVNGSGLPLEGPGGDVDQELAEPAGELTDLDLITVVVSEDGTTIRAVPWAAECLKPEPPRHPKEVLCTDLRRREQGAELGPGLEGVPDRPGVSARTAAVVSLATRHVRWKSDYLLDDPPEPTDVRLGCRAWDATEATPDRPCPNCGGRRLPNMAVCVRCSSWGLQRLYKQAPGAPGPVPWVLREQLEAIAQRERLEAGRDRDGYRGGLGA